MASLHDESLFVTQFLLTAAILTLCIYELIHNGQTSVYLPIITVIIGYWLPSPSLAKPTTNTTAIVTSTQPASSTASTSTSVTTNLDNIIISEIPFISSELNKIKNIVAPTHSNINLSHSSTVEDFVNLLPKISSFVENINKSAATSNVSASSSNLQTLYFNRTYSNVSLESPNVMSISDINNLHNHDNIV